MALICLMKRLKLKYREIIEFVDLMPKLQEMIGLKEIPHFKSFKRFGFDEMLDITVELFDIKNLWVAIDGTGHSTDQTSLYYARKIEKQTKKKRKMPSNTKHAKMNRETHKKYQHPITLQTLNDKKLIYF